MSSQLYLSGLEEKASYGVWFDLKSLHDTWATVRLFMESSRVLEKGRICSISMAFENN